MFAALEKSQEAIEITSEDHIIQVCYFGSLSCISGLCAFLGLNPFGIFFFFLSLFEVQGTSFSLEVYQNKICKIQSLR